MRPQPNWTVLYSSPGKDFVGFGVDFFYDEKDAEECYDNHIKIGNSPTKRPFYCDYDIKWMNPSDKYACFGGIIKKGIKSGDKVQFVMNFELKNSWVKKGSTARVLKVLDSTDEVQVDVDNMIGGILTVGNEYVVLKEEK